MAHTLQTTFYNSMSWNIFVHFYSNSNCMELCCYGFIWQVSSGSGNGLAPNRRQAITWTKDDPVHWCINALPSHNVLTNEARRTWQKGKIIICKRIPTVTENNSERSVTNFKWKTKWGQITINVMVKMEKWQNRLSTMVAVISNFRKT